MKKANFDINPRPSKHVCNECSSEMVACDDGRFFCFVCQKKFASLNKKLCVCGHSFGSHVKEL